MTDSRPFQSARIDELERLAATGADPGLLGKLRHELDYRTTRRAAALRQRLDRLLEELDTGTGNTEPPPDDPAPSATPPILQFDSEQRSIVEGDRSRRVIVNAPPGTGKTAVACGRIVHLLRSGVPPHQIWLLSFTRTAIHELRTRIEALGEQTSAAYSVRVATLDSRAWTMIQGMTGVALKDLQSHDNTIASALELLQSDHDEVLDMLDEIEHVIVDEAQDLVGIRRDFVVALISRLPSSAGVTVLTDDAQAIYGFAEEDVEPGIDAVTLPDALRTSRQFEEQELRCVYRTSNPNLKALYIEGRQRVLAEVKAQSGDCLVVARDSITRWKDGPVPDHPGQDGTLHLFRTRLECLQKSTRLGDDATAHRVRMSMLPMPVHPWIALALSDFTGLQLSREEFSQRWARVTRALGGLAPDPDRCWNDMIRIASDGTRVNMGQLREVLSRSRPPLEFSVQDLGLTGPVVGTIHASKGRESDNVNLMLPPIREDEPRPCDEARVLFVGATRARRSLRVCEGTRQYGACLSGGRRYSKARRYGQLRFRARVEIGLEGDLDTVSAVATSLHGTEADAAAGQTFLASNLASPVTARAWMGSKAEGYQMLLRVGDSSDGQPLARLTKELGHQLLAVAKAAWPEESLKPPEYIGPVYMLGACSAVLPSGHPDLELLHRPWASSGIWLAPIVIGLPTIPFFWRRRR